MMICGLRVTSSRNDDLWAPDFRFSEDRSRVQCRICNDHLPPERRDWILVKKGASHLTITPHLKNVELAKEREKEEDP
jgi:hypothetical protein